MKFVLAGFAGSGKTTLFNAMTGLDAPTGRGGSVRMGTVQVPDPRIDFLSGVFQPRRTTHATVKLRDVPGEYGATSQVLSPGALHHFRDAEALCLVLRDFLNPALEAPADPLADLESFHAECVIADLGIVEKRLDRARKERADGREIAAFETMTRALEDGTPLRLVPPAELDRRFLQGYGLLTDLPLLVAVNVAEERVAEPLSAPVAEAAGAMGGAGMVLSARIEAEIATLDPDDQVDFLQELGIAEPTLARFVRATYELMDLISFFTVGPVDVRAWPVRRGTVARAAAGRIHSDLERGFIRAEVIPYEVFAAHGSEQAVKEAGLLQVEGKQYLVQDGDIVHVLFNV